MGLFNRKIEEDLREKGGSMGRSEFKRFIGGKYRVRKEEFPDLFKELERGGKIDVGKRKVSLEDLI